MVELIEQPHLAIEQMIDVVGCITIQIVLEMSAAQVAGPQQQGKLRAGEMVWHGKQAGRVYLKERKLKVLRLRQRGAGLPIRQCKLSPSAAVRSAQRCAVARCGLMFRAG